MYTIPAQCTGCANGRVPAFWGSVLSASELQCDVLDGKLTAPDAWIVY
jgi:hypothetical protein